MRFGIRISSLLHLNSQTQKFLGPIYTVEMPCQFWSLSIVAIAILFANGNLHFEFAQICWK